MMLPFFVKENHFRVHFWYISKDETKNIFNDANLSEKNGSL